MGVSTVLAVAAGLSTLVAADSLASINHVVLFMQENRAFDHWSWGHFKRQDIPIHFAIAEGWTVGDAYQESVIASTNPNRVSWISGSINVPGGPQNVSQGGVYFDNNESPGCEGTNLNCYPLKWQTAPEYYEAANVTWQVYQDTDNFDDNPLAWFSQFQTAAKTSDLYQRGMTFKGLDAFYADAAAGTLPEISYIVGPAELSEHPPYQPKDGAWLQKQVVDAVTKGASYKDTVLIISWDETGGWGDHVLPFHSEPGTPGEWLNDPYGQFGQVFSGPGFRLPFYIVSPWTRGGHVYTESADHSSQIKFIEKWQAAKGKNVTSSQIPAWRRKNMADLTKAFDFSKPDLTLPNLPTAASPITNAAGAYVGYAQCIATHPTQRPPVPYTAQTSANVLGSEQGFKQVRGQLSEGRYLTFEMNGYAISNGGSSGVVAGQAGATHNAKAARWILHQVVIPGKQFKISSALDGRFLTSGGSGLGKAKQAEIFRLNDLGNGRGYTLFDTASKQYTTINKTGHLATSSKPGQGFQVFSVTYSN